MKDRLIAFAIGAAMMLIVLILIDLVKLLFR